MNLCSWNLAKQRCVGKVYRFCIVVRIIGVEQCVSDGRTFGIVDVVAGRTRDGKPAWSGKVRIEQARSILSC